MDSREISITDMVLESADELITPHSNHEAYAMLLEGVENVGTAEKGYAATLMKLWKAVQEKNEDMVHALAAELKRTATGAAAANIRLAAIATVTEWA